MDQVVAPGGHAIPADPRGTTRRNVLKERDRGVTMIGASYVTDQGTPLNNVEEFGLLHGMKAQLRAVGRERDPFRDLGPGPRCHWQ